MRRAVPFVLLPLCLIASLLTAAPWLRSFPVNVAGAPMYGAAVLSVLIPLITVRVRPRWLWLGVLIDVAIFVLYTLIVVLQSPTDFGDLVEGIYRGPSQVLTFALPLVSPRSLMIAPVALIWLAGALAGQCLARRWNSVLPYVGFLVAFGLAYAGTQRAAGSDVSSARTRETLLAAGLLATLLLLRAAQTWLRQEETAESTQPDGVLPLRGLVVGTVTTVLVALIASFAVQSTAFPKRSSTPQRVPLTNSSDPLTPLSFVAGMRPRTDTTAAQQVFSVNLNEPSAGYFAIANVDQYDGSGWTFTRTFRPSGGVLPDDTDTALRTGGSLIQQYRIADGPLTSGPWMPFVYRAQKVTGTSVNIDPTSGMIVPADRLRAGVSYTVQSGTSQTTFATLKTATATADTTTPAVDSVVPAGLSVSLDRLIKAFAEETGTPSTPALPFLRALQRDLTTRYALSDAAQGSSTGLASGSSSAAPSGTAAGTPATSAATSTAQTSSATSSTAAPSSTAASSSHGTRDERVRPLAAGTAAKKSTARASTPKKSATKKVTPRPTAKPTSAAATSPAPSSATSSSAGPASDLAGGTGFADVLASILGTSRSGTPEQFATLVAMVARELGVPARVVTGFRVQPGDHAAQLAPGQYDVTTADAWTWVEIPVVGSGWVVLDASPGNYSQDAQQTESAAPAPSSSSAPPSQNALVTAGDQGNAVAPKSTTPDTSAVPRDGLLIALLVAVAALALALLLVLLSRKRVRARRRRRSTDPRTRLIGAWQETLDVLTEAGLPELTTLTSAEIAELTADQFGADCGAQAAALGTAANAVAYSNATVISPEQADHAWSEHRELRTQIRRQLGVRGRFAANLRYHRPKKAQRPVSPPSWAVAAAALRSQQLGTSAGPVGPTGRRYRGRRRAH